MTNSERGLSGLHLREALAPPPADALDDDQRDLRAGIVGGPRSDGPALFELVDDDGGLLGPFGTWLLQPALGAAVQDLGAAIRFRTGLSLRTREVAILVVGACWSSPYEWYAHERVGRHVGLTDDEIAALRDGRCDELPPDEALVADAARALTVDGDLTDEVIGRLVDAIGVDGLFELTTLVGYYALIARQMRVFRVGAPAPTPFD